MIPPDRSRALTWVLAFACVTLAAALVIAPLGGGGESGEARSDPSRDRYCADVAADVAFLRDGLRAPTTAKLLSPIVMRSVERAAKYCAPGHAQDIEQLALHLRTSFAVLVSDNHPPGKVERAMRDATEQLDELLALLEPE